MLVRFLYSLVWYLATPYVLLYLKRRGRKNPSYNKNWNERFALGSGPIRKNIIWIHAVSVGETRAALPLVTAIKAQWPEMKILLTQMTPTGRACALALYGDAVEVCYLPYDYPGAVRRFLRTWQPHFGVIMETEIWPNLVAAARAAGVPLFLVNARLSEKSLKGYEHVKWLVRPALQMLTKIACQTKEDSRRLQKIGAINPVVCGNTKYDIVPPATLLALGDTFKERIGSRPVLVCASTRKGEEELILQAWQAYTGNCLLVIVPRHPERFQDVAGLASAAGFRLQCRSDNSKVDPFTQVWLGDSMGEMFAYYRMADLVFIGGSLLPYGGQNLIEPASLGIPVVIGHSTYNFADACEKALQQGAVRQIETAEQLLALAERLPCPQEAQQAMAQAGIAFSQAERGASQKILDMIRTSLPMEKR